MTDEQRITTVWEYIEGTHEGLRFSSGDVDEWPGCKLIAREVGMSEEKRLALCEVPGKFGLMLAARLREKAEMVAQWSG